MATYAAADYEHVAFEDRPVDGGRVVDCFNVGFQ